MYIFTFIKISKKIVKKSKIIIDILTNMSIIILVRTLRDTKDKKYPLRYLQNPNFINLLITINKNGLHSPFKSKSNLTF